MNAQIYKQLVNTINEEMEKEHEDQAYTAPGGVEIMQPWNKFSVSLNNLGYNVDAYDDNGHNSILAMIMTKLKKNLPYLEFTYEVPEGKQDNRHYIYKMLPRMGHKDHYNIVILLQ